MGGSCCRGHGPTDRQGRALREQEARVEDQEDLVRDEDALGPRTNSAALLRGARLVTKIKKIWRLKRLWAHLGQYLQIVAKQRRDGGSDGCANGAARGRHVR